MADEDFETEPEQDQSELGAISETDAERNARAKKLAALMKLPVTELAAKLAVLREMKAYHEGLAKRFGSEIAIVGEAVFERFMESNTANLRLSGSLFADTRARIVTPDLLYRPAVKNVAALFQWCRATMHSHFIKETIHPKTLETFVNQSKKANLPLPDESILAVFNVKTAKVRRASK